MIAPARTITYTAGGWVGFIHYATLTGLKPSTAYYYSVGSNANGFSDVYRFLTAAPPGPARGFDWLVVGDMGADPEAINTIARLTPFASANSIDSVLHIGDIGYQDGVQHRWDLYMRMIQGVSGQLPYMVRHISPFRQLRVNSSIPNLCAYISSPSRLFPEITRLPFNTICTYRGTSTASRCPSYQETSQMTCRVTTSGRWTWGLFTLLALTLSILWISLMSPLLKLPGSSRTWLAPTPTERMCLGSSFPDTDLYGAHRIVAIALFSLPSFVNCWRISSISISARTRISNAFQPANEFCRLVSLL